jgi:hypothetical protein
MRARFKNWCHMCTGEILPGSEIRKSRSGKWIHRPCWDYAAAKQAINAGTTLASQRRSDWKMGKSPSSQNRRLG